jgi:hypothetical protein
MVFKKENNFVIFEFNKPLLTITVKEGNPTSEEWEETKTIIKSFYESAKIGNFRFSMIFDLRKLSMLPLSYFQEWADLFLDYKEKTGKYIHRTSIIINNMVIRTSINLFFKIYTTVRPMLFAETIEKANEFVMQDFKINVLKCDINHSKG